jgi:serine O-acetyltransferase
MRLNEEKIDIVCGFSSRICMTVYLSSHWLAKRKMMAISRALQFANRILSGADIDACAVIAPDVKIPHTIGLVIGETSVVEKGVVLMPHVVLGARSHSPGVGRRHPHICEGAYIGAGAVIVGGITVGRYATVGANAVVTKDVAEEATVVGIPAKVVCREVDGGNSDQEPI